MVVREQDGRATRRAMGADKINNWQQQPGQRATNTVQRRGRIPRSADAHILSSTSLYNERPGQGQDPSSTLNFPHTAHSYAVHSHSRGETIQHPTNLSATTSASALRFCPPLPRKTAPRTASASLQSTCPPHPGTASALGLYASLRAQAAPYVVFIRVDTAYSVAEEQDKLASHIRRY